MTVKSTGGSGSGLQAFQQAEQQMTTDRKALLAGQPGVTKSTIAQDYHAVVKGFHEAVKQGANKSQLGQQAAQDEELRHALRIDAALSTGSSQEVSKLVDGAFKHMLQWTGSSDSPATQSAFSQQMSNLLQQEGLSQQQIAQALGSVSTFSPSSSTDSAGTISGASISSPSISSPSISSPSNSAPALP